MQAKVFMGHLIVKFVEQSAVAPRSCIPFPAANRRRQCYQIVRAQKINFTAACGKTAQAAIDA